MSKITINNIKILSSWEYDLPTNTDCTICRCNLNSNSLYNMDSEKDSIIITGVCDHSFHAECIKPWVDSNKHCPICSKEWHYKK